MGPLDAMSSPPYSTLQWLGGWVPIAIVVAAPQPTHPILHIRPLTSRRDGRRGNRECPVTHQLTAVWLDQIPDVAPYIIHLPVGRPPT